MGTGMPTKGSPTGNFTCTKIGENWRLGPRPQGPLCQIRPHTFGARTYLPTHNRGPGGCGGAPPRTQSVLALFVSCAFPQGGQGGTNVRGAFGALIIHHRHTTWTDPVTGEDCPDCIFADICPERPHDPPNDARPFWEPVEKYPVKHGVKCFREYAIIFHDEPAVKRAQWFVEACDGGRCRPHCDTSEAGVEDRSVMGINFRSEHADNRVFECNKFKRWKLDKFSGVSSTQDRRDFPRLFFRPNVSDESCQGEEIHHNSWVMGDPPEYLIPRVCSVPSTRLQRSCPFVPQGGHAGDVGEGNTFSVCWEGMA